MPVKRGKRILVVCHCLLNANAKVVPLATCPGVCMEPLRASIEAGVGLVQLPCPETVAMGMRRFGMTKEQYEHAAFRRQCRAMLEPVLDQIQAFAAAGYEITGLVGVDGSPNCGVRTTCFGYEGGEISAPESNIPEQLANITFGPGQGVFMEELLAGLGARHIDVPLFAVEESNPEQLVAVDRRTFE